MRELYLVPLPQLSFWDRMTGHSLVIKQLWSLVIKQLTWILKKGRFPSKYIVHYHHFSSVIQLCQTLCDPMDCSTPGFPVHHQLSELAQTHAHWVSDTFQPFHPMFPPSPTLSFSQHQGLFQWIGSSHQVTQGIGASASVPPMTIQNWFPLGWQFTNGA